MIDNRIRELKKTRKKSKKNWKSLSTVRKIALESRINAIKSLTKEIKRLQDLRINKLTQEGKVYKMVVRNRNKYNQTNTNHKAKHLRG